MHAVLPRVKETPPPPIGLEPGPDSFVSTPETSDKSGSVPLRAALLKLLVSDALDDHHLAEFASKITSSFLPSFCCFFLSRRAQDLTAALMNFYCEKNYSRFPSVPSSRRFDTSGWFPATCVAAFFSAASRVASTQAEVFRQIFTVVNRL